MKHALYASQQALKDYAEASYHERLNIMTRYFEEDLPIVVEETLKGQQEIEQLKVRNIELEGERE